MSKGIYTALSGAIAQGQKLETIANNIANANTPGFKRDQQVFKEYLSSYERPPDVIEVPKIPASIESFYDMQGGDKSYVDNAGTFTDHSQGSLKATGNTLDLALEGRGFFEVNTPGGVRYTRHGSFKIDNLGRLVTKEGFPVLAAGEGDPNGRTIQLRNSKIVITGRGEIYQGGEAAGRLSVVNVGPMDSLQKTGSSFYKIRDNFNPVVSPDQEGSIHQGFLEASNVDVIREMTDMIATNRSFESSQRVIMAYDELSEKLNTIPKLEG